MKNLKEKMIEDLEAFFYKNNSLQESDIFDMRHFFYKNMYTFTYKNTILKAQNSKISQETLTF